MLYWNVKRRIFPAKLWAFHMHSLANKVVCTNLIFLVPKDVEKKFEKSLTFFKVKILLNQKPQEPKNAANGPNGFVGT